MTRGQTVGSEGTWTRRRVRPFRLLEVTFHTHDEREALDRTPTADGLFARATAARSSSDSPARRRVPSPVAPTDSGAHV